MPDEIEWRSVWKPSELEEGFYWVRARDSARDLAVIQNDGFGVWLTASDLPIEDDLDYELGPRIRPEDSAELERLREMVDYVQDRLLDAIGTASFEGCEKASRLCIEIRGRVFAYLLDEDKPSPEETPPQRSELARLREENAALRERISDMDRPIQEVWEDNR